MTSSHADTDLSTGTDYDALASRFRRIVGDWIVNGRTPPFGWRVGNGAGAGTETGAAR
ncbi:hypothetical protein [Burkholderia anthina]|uniref:hypothetical protein n=1 Tax=Burkholderia anthina TaxID=179879 RepID=UPI001AA04253|nr:hypothetical protein [Burkholderia anthina]QTD94395.1 hypothetical protein J4G50_27665 [Burkholderia anthina]